MLFPEKYEDLTYRMVTDDELFDAKLTDFDFEYAVLIFYPLDFTFVCPTEIIAFSDMKHTWDMHKAKIFFISGDSQYSHLAWTKLSRDQNGIGKINYPMIADMTHSLSTQFNLFDEKNGTVMRSTVILNKSLETLHISANIDMVGRSTNEIVRLLKAFSHSSKMGEICPVNFE